MIYFLAIYGNTITLSDALFISIFAMVVVFLVLLIISYMVDFTSFLLNRNNKKNSDNNNEKVSVEENSSNQNVSDSHLVAIISAAIASYMKVPTDNLHIKSIRRIKQDNTAWNDKNLMF